MKKIVLLFALIVSAAAYAAETDGILKALAQKCDVIDDEYMLKKTGTEARRAIMKSVRGEIGCISYESEFELKDRGSRASGSFGSTYTGSKGLNLFPPGGEYKLTLPADFDDKVKAWKLGLKMKDADATGELAAALFIEAIKRDGVMNESKMFGLFKTSAEGGNADAMFMQAICHYYGIGCTKSRPTAYKRLEDWKRMSGTTKAKRGGWIARRFEFINR